MARWQDDLCLIVAKFCNLCSSDQRWFIARCGNVTTQFSPQKLVRSNCSSHYCRQTNEVCSYSRLSRLMTFSLSTFQTHGKSTAISIIQRICLCKSSTNVDIFCKFQQPFPAVADKAADGRSAAVERVRIGLFGAGWCWLLIPSDPSLSDTQLNSAFAARGPASPCWHCAVTVRAPLVPRWCLAEAAANQAPLSPARPMEAQCGVAQPSRVMNDRLWSMVAANCLHHSAPDSNRDTLGSSRQSYRASILFMK